MEKIYILLFYKFKKIENTIEFRDNHIRFCKDLGIFGRILVAEEGINGSVSGTKEQVDKYKEYLKSLEGFSDIVFKEESGISHPFTKMKVLIKPEIVALKKEVDLSNTGEYLEPKELFELYKEDKIGEEYVIIDGRNSYEYKVGRFKGAIDPGTKTFRELPKKLKDLEKFKDKKIIMYCTGGIRCEKATALLKENGFNEVYQLKDGIINFCQQYPNTFWEGSCFVFDKRMVSGIDQDSKPITKCEICGTSCDLYKNCRNVDCDKLAIICLNCQEKMVGCCSEDCFKKFKDYCIRKSIERQGRKVKALQ